MSTIYEEQYNFDNFIMSACNQDALALSGSIIDDACGKFLAIYGPSSCGKSHLLNAIKSAYQKKYPKRSVLLSTYEEIISVFMDALNKKKEKSFRKTICSYDLLIIDNMQFVAGKSATQEELSYWFCEMLGEDKSVVIAFDVPADYVSVLINRMKERYLYNSNIVEIKEADTDLRRKFLDRVLKEHSIRLPENVYEKLIRLHEIPFCAFRGYLNKLRVIQEQNGNRLTDNEMIECINDYRGDLSNEV